MIASHQLGRFSKKKNQTASTRVHDLADRKWRKSAGVRHCVSRDIDFLSKHRRSPYCIRPTRFRKCPSAEQGEHERRVKDLCVLRMWCGAHHILCYHYLLLCLLVGLKWPGVFAHSTGTIYQALASWSIFGISSNFFFLYIYKQPVFSTFSYILGYFYNK